MVDNERPYTNFKEYMEEELKQSKHLNSCYHENNIERYYAENQLQILKKVIEMRMYYFHNTRNSKQTMYLLYEYLKQSYEQNLLENKNAKYEFTREVRTGIVETLFNTLSHIERYKIIRDYVYKRGLNFIA